MITANKGVGRGVKAHRISREYILFAISMARREEGQPALLEESVPLLCFHFGLVATGGRT